MILHEELKRAAQLGNDRDVRRILDTLMTALPSAAATNTRAARKKTWFQTRFEEQVGALNLELAGDLFDDSGDVIEEMEEMEQDMAEGVDRCRRLEESVVATVRDTLARIGEVVMDIEAQAMAIVNWRKAQEDGDTPLQIGCLFGRAICVEFLVADPRVDVNRKNYHGETALMMASGCTDRRLITFLMECRKAKLATRELMVVKRRELERHIARRIERRAWGSMGLDFPARARHRPFVSVWGDNLACAPYDIDLMAASNYGTTALWSCSCFGNVAGAKFVLANLPDGQEEVALQTKKISGNFQVNTTPLQVAEKEGSLPIILFFFLCFLHRSLSQRSD